MVLLFFFHEKYTIYINVYTIQSVLSNEETEDIRYRLLAVGK